MRKQNPIFSSMDNAYVGVSGKTATFRGIGVKLLICTAFTLLGVFTCYLAPSLIMTMQMPLLFSLIGIQFLMVMAISKNPSKARFYSLLYSYMLGLLYGVIIVIFCTIYDGVVESALITTMAVLAAISFGYFTGLIRNGSMLKKITFTLGFTFLIFMGFNMILSLFGTGIYTSTNPSTYLLISLISAAIAILYLVQSLDACSRLVYSRGPKEYEWTVSLGLLCNLLWLFVELIQIFALFANNDN